VTRDLRKGFDRVLRRAQLGVQFRDALDRRVVADGLRVDLLDAHRPAKNVRLHPNPSGVFVAHGLPGLNGFAEPETSSPPGIDPGRFSLVVRDTWSRFVDARVGLDLPSDGLFQPACLSASPGDAPPHVPLYSASTRPLPGAVAVVRADLRLASNPERPASWARVELWLGTVRLAVGVADRDGGLVLLCPLPTPREPTRRASPPAGFDRMRWDVSLRAHWNPAHRSEAVPELCDIHAQPEVGLLGAGSPPAPLATIVLSAGEPLSVATADSSFLFVAA